MNTINLPLSIGILSWKAHSTLLNTLQSYLDSDLLSVVTDVFIFFQEISAEDKAIAEKYNIKYFGSESNLGIAGGYREMLKYVIQPNYLFLENDWFIPQDHYSLVGPFLSFATGSLENNSIDLVRFRNRKNPGAPLWTAQFKDVELSRPEHLLDCVHWVADPDKIFPEYIKSPAPGWYSTTSKYANWTNNPHMMRTDWTKEVLLPHLGQRDIEKDLQKWWQTSEYKVLQGEGLFTHHRL